MQSKLCLMAFYLVVLNLFINSNTFFLYTEETCNDQVVMLEESVREGILEEIFEAGFIIIDDISEKKYEIPVLISQVPGYGARFLVVVSVQSQKTALTEKTDMITSNASYALYDSKTKKLLGENKLNKEDKVEKTKASAAQFWFNLGIEIAKAIEKIYEQTAQ